MALHAVIYSSSIIRGKILLNTLGLKGIHARLFATHFEAEEALKEHSPNILILDAGREPNKELRFLQSLANRYPGKVFLALLNPSDIPRVRDLDLSNLKYAPEPIDPEYILSIVQGALSGRYRISLFARRLYQTFLWFNRFFLKALAIAVVLAMGLAAGYIYWCISTLPDIGVLKDSSPYQASKLYASDNTLLTEFYVERRTFIRNDNIPEHLKNAFIAVEDKRFYEHFGIDIIRTLGAFLTDVRKGAFMEGGSTITQQLAKMVFLTPEKTITRKIKEIVLSLEIEDRFTKGEILELYLNKAYFGSRAYGIEAASQTYFGKSAIDLNISESALLAALPKAPSKYSPFNEPVNALKRRNNVLMTMRNAGFLSENEFKAALRDPLPEKYHGRKYKAPYFLDYCRKVLEKRFGRRLYTAGLDIYTTLDLRMQHIAEETIQEGIEELEEQVKGGIQAALVAVELNTGHIKAMVGGRNFWESQFNRVTQAKRQTGSAFKPIVYLTALEQGFRPDYKVEDRMATYSTSSGRYTWTPRNYDGVYHRTVTLKTALARSLNAATVRIAKAVGIGNIIKTAEALGIKSEIHPYYSSALGASELSLMELVYAYAAFAHGRRVEPICIDSVIDRTKVIYSDPSRFQKRVISENALHGIRDMLRTVILKGTGRKAKVLKKKVFGKTGTTDGYADAWFIGFDNKTVVGVWVGRDKRTTIGNGITGAKAALPIWLKFMKRIDNSAEYDTGYQAKVVN